jgi:alkanesulfonate monooxygenase SsuD/methylene tetrahydromethanopterin reductase-like flavin-dependent oxidoreductase (luciferase family)
VDIGIGLPNTVPGTPGPTITEWAKRSETRGFTSLGTIGRIVWPGYDELIALTAGAAVTEQIRLFTNVLLAPLWSTAFLARATASLDQVSGGRLRLGLGVGGRPDDFEASSIDATTRGQRFDEQLEVLHAAWRSEATGRFAHPFGPGAVNLRVPILFGGDPLRAARRAARWNAEGFTIGGAPAEAAAEAVSTFRSAYADAGGTGTPRIVCLAYFSLGDDRLEESLAYLRGYYEFTGEYAEMISRSAARDPDEIRRRIEAFEEAGADELILDPSSFALDQVDRLADVVFG